MKDKIKAILREALENTTDVHKDADEKKIVAGALIKCSSTNNIFLLLRNDRTPTWALVSGGIKNHENPLEGLKREIYEELFIKPNILTFKFIRVEHIPEKNMEFHYFEASCQYEFKPILDEENLEWRWFSKDKLPSPLYKGLNEKIANI